MSEHVFMCAHKTRLPVFLTNSNLRRKQFQKNKGMRFGTGLSFRQALVVLGWVSCASSAQKRGLGEGILHAQGPQASSRGGCPGLM